MLFLRGSGASSVASDGNGCGVIIITNIHFNFF
jgi:hypothetical protein